MRESSSFWNSDSLFREEKEGIKESSGGVSRAFSEGF
jgi:hypothetical protein